MPKVTQMRNGRSKILTQTFLVSQPLFQNNVLPPVGMAYISAGKTSLMEAGLHVAEFPRSGLISFELEMIAAKYAISLNVSQWPLNEMLCFSVLKQTLASEWRDLISMK